MNGGGRNDADTENMGPVEDSKPVIQALHPASSSSSTRLNANFRLSTALPASSVGNIAGNLCGLQQASSSSTLSDWIPHPNGSYSLYQQHGGTASSSTALDGNSLFAYDASSAHQQTTMTAAAAAAATGVTKFEPGTSVSAATAMAAAANASTGCFNWSNVATASEWELATANAIGRSGLDSRLISTPPYYNPANYPSGAAYLYTPQHYYSHLRSNAAPFQNYFAGNSTSANGLSMNHASSYVSAGGCTASNSNPNRSSSSATNFDYYGLNSYYDTSALDADALCGRNSSAYNANFLQQQYKGIGGFLSNGGVDPTALIGLQQQNTPSSQLSPLLSTSIGGPSSSVGAGSKSEKTTKRSTTKRKKLNGSNGSNGGGVTSTPEPNNQRVFIWELEDLCILASHPYRAVDSFMLQVIEQILRCGFHIDHLEECDQANIEDTNVVEESETMNEMYNPLCGSGLESSAATLNGSGNSECRASTTGSSSPPITNKRATPTATVTNNFQMHVSEQFAAGGGPSTSGSQHRGAMEGIRRMAAKYQNIRSTYEQFASNLSDFLDFCGLTNQKTEIQKRFSDYDKLSGCQTERYRRCLKIILDRSPLIKDRCTNIVITNESLASSLAKLLAFDLASYVPIDNVYSTTKVTKEVVMGRIGERFKKQHAVIVSSSPETGLLAKREGIPFWMIHSLRDVDAFLFALDTILLVDTTSSCQAALINHETDTRQRGGLVLSEGPF